MTSRLRSSPWIAFEDERLSFFPVALPGAAGLDVMCDVTSCLDACGVAWEKTNLKDDFVNLKLVWLLTVLGTSGVLPNPGAGGETMP
jgi:hypothetical protein